MNISVEIYMKLAIFGASCQQGLVAGNLGLSSSCQHGMACTSVFENIPVCCVPTVVKSDTLTQTIQISTPFYKFKKTLDLCYPFSFQNAPKLTCSYPIST